MKSLIESEKVISGPAFRWPAKEAQKMSARSVKISWRSVKTSHQWNKLFLKKILNSANVIFASDSLGSRRSDCGDGAKIRKNSERVGGGGGE